ncbi:MAG: hypothetical protein Q4B33_04555 [Fusobacterium sp.]|nr:hypothetical protein [Fusobacterium sp.]
MEKHIVTKQEKESYLEKFPVLLCENSYGIDYDDYISIKCKKIMGTCTYRNSNKSDFLNCKILNK